MRPALILLFCLIVIPFTARSQNGYKLDFQITGLTDTTAYLGFFLDEKTYIKDTARVSNKGAFVFQNSKLLPHGIYFLVLNKARVFDFVIGSDQHFSIQTSSPDFAKNIVVKGDDDNKLFYENLFFDAEREKEARPLLAVLKDSTATEDKKHDAKEALTRINEKVIAHRNRIIENHGNTVTARLLKMNKPVSIPDDLKKTDDGSNRQYWYYRKHYFDNFDLGDGLTVRTPKVFFGDKVNEYLTRMILQHPDTIIREIDKLAAIAKRDRDTYRNLIWKCLVNYQTPELMGLDEVYVHIVNKYIATGEMDYWLDKKTIQNLKDYAAKVDNAMIGRIAPNLVMQDDKLLPRELYNLTSKYSIVFFFMPDCPHCREETPKLVEFYNKAKSKYDFEVFAVSSDTSIAEMRDFIREMKTPWVTVSGPRSYIRPHFTELYFVETFPTVYILDEKKKVIARKISVDQFADFFANHEKQKSKAP